MNMVPAFQKRKPFFPTYVYGVAESTQLQEQQTTRNYAEVLLDFSNVSHLLKNAGTAPPTCIRSGPLARCLPEWGLHSSVFK